VIGAGDAGAVAVAVAVVADVGGAADVEAPPVDGVTIGVTIGLAPVVAATNPPDPSAALLVPHPAPRAIEISATAPIPNHRVRRRSTVLLFMLPTFGP
jgi:hypothetical protein